jgi:dihydrolipoamide dehydrogenase
MKLIIIGAGPAGEAAAKTARRLSAGLDESIDITVIEKEQAGGLCLNKGCIPSKTLLESVKKKADAGVAIDWSEIQKFKGQVVSTLRSHLETAFKLAKINLLRGSASFLSPTTIEVRTGDATQILTFDKAIIATGTETFFPR